ncbi:mannose-binding lectin superfamily protein [Striga asiatica]|uniref:Mannose-binding lectin superfamily protein n=1 Tax=Striga asiatica TaxID=4170 RepID=A0A5A7PWB8_STRAF|nr:mannose-binding lectin superfamily protein [Striga asiatica]
MVLEKCLRRRGITPGIQSIGVSSITHGTPTRSAASSAKSIAVSAITQVTGGTSELRLCMSSLSGARQLSLVERHKDLMSWVEFAAFSGCVGRPSGMETNRKVGWEGRGPWDWWRRVRL